MRRNNPVGLFVFFFLLFVLFFFYFIFIESTEVTNLARLTRAAPHNQNANNIFTMTQKRSLIIARALIRPTYTQNVIMVPDEKKRSIKKKNFFFNIITDGRV